MKNSIASLILFSLAFTTSAQTDKDQFALKVAAADEANMKNLMQYIWKRKGDVTVDGQVKASALSEFSFDATGKLQTKVIEATSTESQKRGMRGRAQSSAVEEKSDYVEKALNLSIAYTFMTKGQLMDFIGKAKLTEGAGTTEATATDVYVKGDKLTVVIDSKTLLYKSRKFSSLLDKDAIDGEINYESFSNGTNHASTTMLNMPAQKMKIDAKNQDYTIRVK